METASKIRMFPTLSFFLLLSTDWILEDERLIVTNSGGAVIGGSCGGMVLFCVVIYILYRLFTRSESNVIHAQPEGATNQNGTVCPRCRNAPSSPPPPYDDSFSLDPTVAWEDCTACRSTADHKKY